VDYGSDMAIALRKKILENSQQFLTPGEEVQAVIAGQTLSGWLGGLSALVYFWNNFRVVLVTDQRILVLDCGKLRLGKPKSVVRELPRATRIGTPSGLWWKCTTLGEKLYVHKRFHKDVVAADAAIVT
jgi:hypothetical protein